MDRSLWFITVYHGNHQSFYLYETPFMGGRDLVEVETQKFVNANFVDATYKVTASAMNSKLKPEGFVCLEFGTPYYDNSTNQ